jgi:RNA polymerase sigma-70 factor (ECF subfamily)
LEFAPEGAVSWLDLSRQLSKFYKGLLLSQGFVATPRALASVAPEIRGTEDDADRDLIARIQNRDKDAFFRLYLRYHRKLVGFLTRLTRSREAADKIISETLWVVWSRAGSFNDASRVSTWIVGIAYRRSLKSLRRAAPCEREYEYEREAMAEDAGHVAGEQQEFIRALDRLPLKLRFVVEFAYSLGQSCPEIALIMQCSADAAAARMCRARRRLKCARMPKPEPTGLLSPRYVVPEM